MAMQQIILQQHMLLNQQLLMQKGATTNLSQTDSSQAVNPSLTSCTSDKISASIFTSPNINSVALGSHSSSCDGSTSSKRENSTSNKKPSKNVLKKKAESLRKKKSNEKSQISSVLECEENDDKKEKRVMPLRSASNSSVERSSLDKSPLLDTLPGQSTSLISPPPLLLPPFSPLLPPSNASSPSPSDSASLLLNPFLSFMSSPPFMPIVFPSDSSPLQIQSNTLPSHPVPFSPNFANSTPQQQYFNAMLLLQQQQQQQRSFPFKSTSQHLHSLTKNPSESSSSSQTHDLASVAPQSTCVTHLDSVLPAHADVASPCKDGRLKQTEVESLSGQASPQVEPVAPEPAPLPFPVSSPDASPTNVRKSFVESMLPSASQQNVKRVRGIAILPSPVLNTSKQSTSAQNHQSSQLSNPVLSGNFNSVNN
eukprot:GDKJ01017262.1.p1 GENE.GDKJ01017262.1~~GDKJ01017262.1.p1  ORF type:complete len:465 (+),score=157.90 GDKJ01017262.1:126-1397(+)